MHLEAEASRARAKCPINTKSITPLRVNSHGVILFAFAWFVTFANFRFFARLIAKSVLIFMQLCGNVLTELMN